VIVDPYGSPTIQADLTYFDQETGLPAPPSFQFIAPDGPVPAYDPTLYPDQPGWGLETSLDVEYSHTIAPDANILLVETPADETEGEQGFPEIVEAENYVIANHLGDVITQSFGATEQTFPPGGILSLRSAYEAAQAANITVLASSGDDGATNYQPNGTDLYPFPTVGWPASDPLVTGVGGTQLHLNAEGNRTQPDNVWNDPFSVCGGPCAGAGGLSTVFSRPTFQNGVAGIVGNARGIPDVSMSAAVNGAADVYFSFVYPGVGSGWLLVGGTSEASPEFSGEVALADQIAGHPLGDINPTLYALGDHSLGLTDITTGNNTVTFTNGNGVTYKVKGYSAAPGYDLASGLGTPTGLFPFELAAGGASGDSGDDR
jgi:subtilase family serine protease